MNSPASFRLIASIQGMNRFLARVALALTAFAALPLGVRADDPITLTWTGNGENSDVTDLDNWDDLDSFPTEPIELLVFGEAAAGTVVIPDDAAVVTRDIVFGEDRPIYQFSGSGANPKLTLVGDVTVEDGNYVRFNASLSLTLIGASTPVVHHVDVRGPSTNLLFDGNLTEENGVARIFKTGSGKLTLGGANSFSGGLIIEEGTVQLDSDGARGVGNKITLRGDGTLRLNAPEALDAGVDLLFSGSVGGRGGVLLLNGRSVSVGEISSDEDAGEIANDGEGAATLTIDFSEVTRTYHGTIRDSLSIVPQDEISGPSLALVKTGSGQLTLTGINTYSGGTTLLGGTLSIATDAALGAVPGAPTPGHLTLDGGTLEATDSFALHSHRGVKLEAQGGILKVSDGETLSYGGTIAGSGDLWKTGSGSLSLSGASPAFTGTVHVSSGTLHISHANAFASPSVIVGGYGDDARFGGVGSLTATLHLHSDGGVAPGGVNTAGALSVGSTTFYGGSFIEFHISSTSGAAGTDWSLLNVNGTLSFDATVSGGTPITIYIQGVGALAGQNSYLTEPYQWLFLTASNIDVSVNPNLFVFEGPETGDFHVTMSGHNVFLNYTPAAIPEPSTYALLLVGLAAVALTLRRRSRSS